MYSPALLPSSNRAAPAKKRRLSTQTGISSRAYESGLPTLRDSSSASSSAFSSSASASLSSASARSPGVVSSHSGSALLAAATARSTSASVPRGTSAIVSPVAGFSTGIVPPSTASTQSPPTKLRYFTSVLIPRPPIEELLAQLEVGHRLGLGDAVDGAQAVRQREQVGGVRADDL